jgi:hypothetical protein
MLYQRAPLDARHEYFLDCACEVDEINAFDHAVLTLLGDRQIVGRMMDYAENWDGPRPLRLRMAACLRLDAYAHQIVAELPVHEQRAFAAVGMQREPLRLGSLAEYLARFNFEDQTTGGAAMDFRRYQRCDRNYDPTPRARRHLYAPSAIRRYVKREADSLPFAQQLAAGLRRLPTSAPEEVGLINDLLHEQRESHRQTYVATRAAFQDEQRKRWASLGVGPGIAPRQRRAVSKAAQFAAGIIGERQVGSFARGEAITLQGNTFNLTVARRTSIAEAGHGALDVRLCATDGLPLASVCVYFDKTPALDQVAALAMHMASGEESAVIETGNLFAITTAGAEHPLVQQRLARPPAPEAQAAMDRFARYGQSQSEFDRKRAAVDRYTADTRGIYLHAVMTRIWGRDTPRLVAFSEKYLAQHRAPDPERIAA